jgi:hypothetical protein
MADGAADWQTAVFRRFKIQFDGAAYNDFLPQAQRLINPNDAHYACGDASPHQNHNCAANNAAMSHNRSARKR